MPVYDYRCPKHGVFSAMRPMKDYEQPFPCPGCNEPAPRVFIRVPNIMGITTEARRAHEVNERSKHSPMTSGTYRENHGAGCSCCKAVNKPDTVDNNPKLKSFKSKRPWMISH